MKITNDERFDFWHRQTLREKAMMILADWATDRKHKDKEIKQLQARLKEAERLILVAKREFAPNTTNSDADMYIEKYIDKE